MTIVKIASYNIQSCVGTTKGYMQYFSTFWKYCMPHSQRYLYNIVDFINRQDIDVMAFSEADEPSFRSKGVCHSMACSELTSLKQGTFFPTYNLFKILKQGNMIRSKYPVINIRNHKLPGRRRYLGESIIDVDGKKVGVYVAHLSLGKKRRAEQVKMVKDIISKSKYPSILMGDFNCEEDELGDLMDFMNRADTGHTFPSWNPRRKIDHMFVSDGLEIVDSYVPSLQFSDHLPIVSEIRVS